MNSVGLEILCEERVINGTFSYPKQCDYFDGFLIANASKREDFNTYGLVIWLSLAGLLKNRQINLEIFFIVTVLKILSNSLSTSLSSRLKKTSTFWYSEMSSLKLMGDHAGSFRFLCNFAHNCILQSQIFWINILYMV